MATKINTAKSAKGTKPGTSSKTTKSVKTTKSATSGKKPKQEDPEESGLRELFLDELKDIYWAEKALVKALPKMAKKATSPNLVLAIEEHLSVTQKQVERLEQVFKSIGEKAEAKKCEAMAGLIKESEEIMKDNEKGIVRDAGIISAAQKVEHYEIASYGTLVSFANTLGESKAAKLLEKTLDEEKDADQELSGIAESSINLKAAKKK